MGIFQLIEYVGVEVCSYIMSVMNPYLKDENLHAELLDTMISQGVLGGQYSSGAQKDGFLKYEKGRPVAIWDVNTKAYVAIDGFAASIDAKLGAMPTSMKPWKAVNFSKKKDDILKEIFTEMKSMNGLGVDLAKAYNTRSNEIGNLLVTRGVAANAEDVNTVMLTGFYHSYGPINQYL
jgi:3-hydroxyacyl-CoA dehydrogenase